MSSSSETQKNIRKMQRKGKRAFNFCSTPEVKNAPKLSSISISAIDTNSSSSTKVVKKKKRLKKYNLEKRKGKKVEKTSKIRGVEKEREKKFIRLRKFDDEWETCDEDLQHSAEFETNVLFKDIESPEHIRDAPPLVLDYLHSPILGVRGLKRDSSQISFEESPEKLPVKDLPSSRLQFDDSDDEELILKRESTVKSYPGARKKKLKKYDDSDQKHMPWLVDVAIPTTSSDRLWEKFVINNSDKLPKYVTLPVIIGQRNDIGSDSDKSYMKEDSDDELPPLWKEKISLGDDTEILRGYWDKSLGKWIRNNDICNFRKNKNDNIDHFREDGNDDIYSFRDEIQRNKKTHNMPTTLKEFRQKINAKRNITKLGSSSSAVLDAADIAENSPFKSQLNEKVKTMFSDKSSADSSPKYPKPRSLPKRIYENGICKKGDDVKKINLTLKKKKPTIVSEALVTGVKFIEDKKGKLYRIVKTVV